MKRLFVIACLASMIAPLSGCIEDGQSFAGNAQRQFQAASMHQARRIAQGARYQIENQVRNQIQRCLPSGAAPLVNIGLGMIRQSTFGGIGLRAAKSRANTKQKLYTAKYEGTVSCPCPLGTRAARTRAAVSRVSSNLTRFVTAEGQVVDYAVVAPNCRAPSSSSSSQKSSNFSSSSSSSAGFQY